MQCLNDACNYYKTDVCDSRRLADGKIWRRRRWCYKCKARYTTLEIPLYLGNTNPEKRVMLQQIATYFSCLPDPYFQWRQAIQLIDRKHDQII